MCLVPSLPTVSQRRWSWSQVAPGDPSALLNAVNVAMPAFWRGQETQCQSCSEVCVSFPEPGLGIRKKRISFQKDTHEGDVFEPGIQGWGRPLQKRRDGRGAFKVRPYQQAQVHWADVKIERKENSCALACHTDKRWTSVISVSLCPPSGDRTPFSLREPLVPVFGCRETFLWPYSRSRTCPRTAQF